MANPNRRINHKIDPYVAYTPISSATVTLEPLLQLMLNGHWERWVTFNQLVKEEKD